MRLGSAQISSKYRRNGTPPNIGEKSRNLGTGLLEDLEKCVTLCRGLRAQLQPLAEMAAELAGEQAAASDLAAG